VEFDPSSSSKPQGGRPREQILSQQTVVNDDLPDGLALLVGRRHNVIPGDHIGEHGRRVIRRDDEQAPQNQ
jgi:hypothetical protein